MPRKARYYATSVLAAGCLLLASALTGWTCASTVRFIACLLLALAGATFKIRVPGIAGTISPSFVPILLAAGIMSWPETVLIALAAGVVQCIWRAKRKPTLLQAGFNGAAVGISIGVAYAVSRSVAGSSAVVLFIAAALVFHLVNTVTVAAVLCLLEEAPLRRVWGSCHMWSFVYHLAGGAVAYTWSIADPRNGVTACVVAVITLYLMSAFLGEVASRAPRTA